MAAEIEMTRCKRCGAKYEATAKKCPSCGKRNPDPKLTVVSDIEKPPVDGKTILRQMFEDQKNKASGFDSVYDIPKADVITIRCKKCDTKYDQTLLKCPACGKKNPNPVELVSPSTSIDDIEAMVADMDNEDDDIEEKVEEKTPTKEMKVSKEEPNDENKQLLDEVGIDAKKPLSKKGVKLAKLIKEEREKAASNEKNMMAKISELTANLASVTEISKNKDLYVSRLYNENYSLKNTCDRLREENRKQNDKMVQDLLTSIAEIFTKADSGVLDNSNEVSAEKQVEFIISKLKNVLVTQDLEIFCPTIGSVHDRQTANCKQTVHTDKPALNGKIALVDSVGIKNTKTDTMIVNAVVHVYSTME